MEIRERSNANIQKLQPRLLSFHSIQMMTSTPKMKMKTRGLFALVEGECDWVVFTGRNYKVWHFLLLSLQPAFCRRSQIGSLDRLTLCIVWESWGCTKYNANHQTSWLYWFDKYFSGFLSAFVTTPKGNWSVFMISFSFIQIQAWNPIITRSWFFTSLEGFPPSRDVWYASRAVVPPRET